MRATAVPRTRFFNALTWCFLAIALIGFSTTFFIPLARNSFEAPAVIHIHGVLLFAWLLLLIAQSSLVHARMLTVHRRLGWSGAVLCVGIVVSGVLVGLHATRRDLAAGGDAFVLGQFVNILIEAGVYGEI
jgi:hypothetical protein